jgi:hydroxypyruvate reductase
VEWFRAGHPNPDEASAAAGERALALAAEAAQAGGLLVLLSGGASAMLAAPSRGVTLEDKLETARALMGAGAPISELNCVRKHLSRIKGGRLAAAAGRTITLALSDVHGPVADDPSVIASGPTVPDPSTFADAWGIVRARRVQLHPRVEAHLTRGMRGQIEETIKPGDARLARSDYRVIGNRDTAGDGCRRAAELRGYRVVVLKAATSGEARDAASSLLDAAARIASDGARPLCVIATGETTVTVRGDGRGGRNQELALAAAARIGDLGNAVVFGSAGTDGIDGPTPAAGAIVDTTTVARARARGLEPAEYLSRNDAYGFFTELGDAIVWGPTGTNVGDVHALLIG